MTNDFDLAIYIKGDQKPTAVYSAELIIDYDSTDVGIKDAGVKISGVAPKRVVFGKPFTVSFTITNFGTFAASNIVYQVTYSDKDVTYTDEIKEVAMLDPDTSTDIEWVYTRDAPNGKVMGNVNAKVNVRVFDDDPSDANPENNQDVIDFKVKKK